MITYAFYNISFLSLCLFVVTSILLILVLGVIIRLYRRKTGINERKKLPRKFSYQTFEQVEQADAHLQIEDPKKICIPNFRKALRKRGIPLSILSDDDSMTQVSMFMSLNEMELQWYNMSNSGEKLSIVDLMPINEIKEVIRGVSPQRIRAGFGEHRSTLVLSLKSTHSRISLLVASESQMIVFIHGIRNILQDLNERLQEGVTHEVTYHPAESEREPEDYDDSDLMETSQLFDDLIIII